MEHSETSHLDSAPLSGDSDIQRLEREKPSQGLAQLARKHGFVIIAAAVLAIYIGHDQYSKYQAGQAAAAAQAKKASDEKEAAKRAEVDELKKQLAAAKAEAEAAKKPLVPAAQASATVGFQGWGVVTGTLFRLDQRTEAATKNANAFGVCQKDGQALTPCFIEVGNKGHSYFATEFVAVPRAAMTEAEATALADCFNDNLPLLDSGEKVGAFATNLSSRRYAGKTCITP